MAEYNEHTYNQMLRQAEKNGENVVFVLERETEFALGGVNCYKVPVPGELDREKHKLAWFMYLPQFHGHKPHVDCNCVACHELDRQARNDSGEPSGHTISLDARRRGLPAPVVPEQNV